jgi:hypothetical protein
VNILDNGLFGEEVGDECSFLIFIPSGKNVTVYFDPSNVTQNGKKNVAQPEYNNSRHACTTAP